MGADELQRLRSTFLGRPLKHPLRDPLQPMQDLRRSAKTSGVKV